MKTKKKIIYGSGLVILLVMLILYACKKEESNTAISPATSNHTGSQPNIMARGTGTKTLYSVDTNGVHYKMELVWNTTTGAVTVDRTIITSGYPAGCVQTNAVEDGITVTKIDLDSDTTSFDTLKITTNPDLQYYLIKFDPSASDPAENLNPGYGYALFCKCDKSGAYICTLRAGIQKNSWYCNGTCPKCGIYGKFVADPFDDGDEVVNGGIYLVEATGVTIIH